MDLDNLPQVKRFQIVGAETPHKMTFAQALQSGVLVSPALLQQATTAQNHKG